VIPFRRILFPVDLSEPSRRAAAYVKAMAERFHSEVLVLHVMELPTAMYAPPEGATWATLSNAEKMKAHYRLLFHAFVRSDFYPMKVREEFLEGDAAHEITDLCHRGEIDLIMMMTHGHGPFRRLLLGSTTAKVLHDCDCPVWTGVHTADLDARDPKRLHSILCAVDTPEKDATVIEWANSFAKGSGAEVRMVHAQSHPDQVVQHDAQKGAADLVIIGRTHSKLSALRSNAYEIIRQSPCPVISVQRTAYASFGTTNAAR
jgi:nucleotide-binding universal stress UspA family protein